MQFNSSNDKLNRMPVWYPVPLYASVPMYRKEKFEETFLQALFCDKRVALLLEIKDVNI